MQFYPAELHHQSTQGILHAILVDLSKGLYRLLEDFEYTVQYRGKPVHFVLPKGFYTNFATIPAFARKFLHPLDPGFIVAAAVHDFVLNEFKSYQPDLTRTFWVDGVEEHINVTFGWNEAADLFKAILVEEGSFNENWRCLFTGLVKTWFVISPYVRHRFTF